MKKVQEIIRPFLAIIIGALMLLYYLNYLQLREMGLVIGIMGVTFAAYYLAIGILEVVLGDKIPAIGRKVLTSISLSLIPFLLFLYSLFIMINNHDALGPTGWTLAILKMVAALAFIVMLMLSMFSKNKLAGRLGFLFAAIFVLALLADILFDFAGVPNALGNLDIIMTVIYILFVSMLMNALSKREEERGQEPAPAPAPAEQPKVEEPVEEQPAEEQPEEAPAEEPKEE